MYYSKCITASSSVQFSSVQLRRFVRAITHGKMLNSSLILHYHVFSSNV